MSSAVCLPPVQVLFVFEIILIVVFHHNLSSIISRLPSQVIFHHKSSSIISRLPSQVVFHHKSASIISCLVSESSNISLVVQIKKIGYRHAHTHRDKATHRARWPSLKITQAVAEVVLSSCSVQVKFRFSQVKIDRSKN